MTAGAFFGGNIGGYAVLLAVRIDARLQIFDDAGTSAFVDCLNQTSHISAHSAKQGDTAKKIRKKSDKKIGFIIVRPPLPVRQRLKGTRTDRTVRAPPLRRRLRIRPPKQPKPPRQISVYIPEERTHGGSGRGFGVGVLRRYIWLCVRINLRITGKARLGRIIPGIRVRDLSVERTRLFFIQRNAPLVYSTEGR